MKENNCFGTYMYADLKFSIGIDINCLNECVTSASDFGWEWGDGFDSLGRGGLW